MKQIFLHTNWLSAPLFQLGVTTVSLLGLFKFFFLILLSYAFAKWAVYSLQKMGKKYHLHSSGVYSLGRLVFYLIFFSGILLAFSSLGIDFTAFAFIAGALSVGIGFAFQPILSNFMAGVLLLLEKKLRVGDLIELESKEKGIVKKIQARTTILQTEDNLEIILPNSELISKKIVNWTLSDSFRKIRVPFRVGFACRKEKLKEFLIPEIQKIVFTFPGKQPQVHLIQIGESSLEFELIVWIRLLENPLSEVFSTYLERIDTVLREQNIPFPEVRTTS